MRVVTSAAFTRLRYVEMLRHVIGSTCSTDKSDSSSSQMRGRLRRSIRCIGARCGGMIALRSDIAFARYVLIVDML